MNDTLLNYIAEAFVSDRANALNKDSTVIEKFILGLESGEIRVAEKIDGQWQVDHRVKSGILLAFRLGQKSKTTLGPFTFIDKENLFPQHFDLSDDIRLVPGGSAVRRGAHVGRDVVIMPPSYVNIGAFIDQGSMLDSNALVGSCAQVGKRVHVSAGAQIGGVLEPIGALPVIIEDDCLIGGNAGIFEGAHIAEGAVIAAGVVLTRSSKIFDLVQEKIIAAGDDGVLRVPPGAVMVAGARALSGEFAQKNGLSLSTPLIIKYRDDQTDKKTALEDLLR